MNNVLVVAVHPDDETLGCGGTLLKHKASGDNIHWLICSETEKNTTFFESREKEIQKVAKKYLFDTIHNLHLRSMHIDEYSDFELVNLFSEVFNIIKPTIIYLPFMNDVHGDHRKIFSAAYSCTKSFRYPFIKKIYMMETLSETEFVVSTSNNFIPNSFVDISDYLEKKIEIMNLYKSEIASHPFPRSEKNIKALATFRGASCGCEYAESFVLLKEII